MPKTASKRSSAPTEIDLAISKRIKSIRTRAGISQADLATHIGIVHQQYHKYESGLNRVSAGMLVKIAEYLDCQVSDLIPPALRGSSELDFDQNLDALKQDVVRLVLESNSESKLLALQVLLTEATQASLNAA